MARLPAIAVVDMLAGCPFSHQNLLHEGVMLPLLLTLSLGAPLDKANDDQKALQGTWVVVVAEMDGKEMKSALKAVMTIKGDKVTIKLVDEQTTEGTFKIDTSARPRAIDLIPNDKDMPTGLGIFQLDGDKLKLCMTESKDPVRPREFKSSKTDILLEFKREKP
jgi:uncharacterized protein (TIGR03067 family)